MPELLTFIASLLVGAVSAALAMVLAAGPAMLAAALVRRPAPTPLPRPETYDLYPQARHRNTNDERTIRLPKLDVLIGGSR